MAESRSLTPISEADYDAIESAVMETERGRWFLGEYARRNRTADTQILLDAISRLEQAVLTERRVLSGDHLRSTLRDMARAVALTREEAADLRAPDRLHGAPSDPEPLFGVVREAEEAAWAGRRAAADIRRAAAALQERGDDPDLWKTIERSSSDVAEAFSRGEASTRTVERIVGTLRYLETRIQEMLSPSEPVVGLAVSSAVSQARAETRSLPLPAAAAPQEADTVETAVFVDVVEPQPSVISEPAPEPEPKQKFEVEIEPAPKLEAKTEPKSEPRRFRREAFAEIDRLSTQEKLRMFT